jgi:hypothetical protein
MKDLEIGSPSSAGEPKKKFEILYERSSEVYTLPKIAEKIGRGEELNEIERIRLHESRRKGRPRKWADQKEKWAYYNARRRKKEKAD